MRLDKKYQPALIEEIFWRYCFFKLSDAIATSMLNLELFEKENEERLIRDVKE